MPERLLPAGTSYSAQKPPTFDGPWMIRRIHRIAENQGYERVRADRGALPDGTYYEVGYGPLLTVHMTTQLGEVYQITKENWDSVSQVAISDMLRRNRGVAE